MRHGKYNNRKITTDAGTFDSQIEYARWLQLSNDPDVICLERQPKYVLIDKQIHHGAKIRAVTYTPDFRYMVDNQWVVEEVKSVATKKAKDYVIRKALFIQRYGCAVKFIETVM